MIEKNKMDEGKNVNYFFFYTPKLRRNRSSYETSGRVYIFTND